MWYDKNKNGLDLSKPIIAEMINGGDKNILLPQIDTDVKRYETVGYNWFNLITGEYTSCCTFDTIEDAINSRTKTGYKLYNMEF